MHSPAQAIVWEICAKNRRPLLVAFGLIPVCTLGQALIPPGKEIAAFMHSMCIMVTVVSIVWVCSYTANDSRGRFTGFPSWMYPLPVRTATMVLWPVLLGAFLISSAVVLWEFAVCHYWNILIRPRNLAWHLLLTTGCLAWVQALVWSLHRFRWIRVAALIAVIYAFLYVGLVAHFWDFSGGAALWFGGVAFAAICAVLVAIVGVERDRRGEWVGWTGRLLECILDFLPRRRRAFDSPSQAQLWIEWRRRGFLLAAFLGVPLPLTMMLLPLPEALFLDPVETVISFSLPLFVGLFLAAAIGSTVAQSDAWSTEHSVHPFIAAKPQSTGALTFAKMRSAAAITLLGWVLFCVLSVPAIIWCNHADWPNEQARSFWPNFSVNFPQLWEWVSNPLVILSIIVVTWHGMIQAMSIALRGSKRRIVFATWTGALIWAALIGIAVWIIETPKRDAVLLFLEVLPFVSFALLSCKLLAAATAFVQAKRLVSRREFFVLMALWVIVAASVLGASMLARVEADAGKKVMWFVVALQFFPAGEIPACVVNLVRNRHR